MSMFDSLTFRSLMYFKFFMVVAVWGLLPLLIPSGWLHYLGLQQVASHILWLRLWGLVVLCDSIVYWYIYQKPRSKLAGYLMLFAVLDNGGFGAVLLLVTVARSLPWGIWINIPFQLFFGWWFWRFFRINRALQ